MNPYRKKGIIGIAVTVCCAIALVIFYRLGVEAKLASSAMYWVYAFAQLGAILLGGISLGYGLKNRAVAKHPEYLYQEQYEEEHLRKDNGRRRKEILEEDEQDRSEDDGTDDGIDEISESDEESDGEEFES